MVKRVKRGRGIGEVSNGYAGVERSNRRGGHRHQLVVERQDLTPVSVLRSWSIAMHGIDSGLNLVRTGMVAAQARAHELLAFADHGVVPAAAVLIGEKYEGAAGADACMLAGPGGSEQPQQSHELGVLRDPHRQPDP